MRPSKQVKADKVCVWAGIYNQNLIGPYFFDGNVDANAYLKMLKTFLIPEMRALGLDLDQIWFQQDGASPHYAILVREWLDENIPQWIGRRGVIPWPARSPDLSPMDFFFWGYIKSKIFRDAPARNKAELKARILAEFEKFDSKILKNVHLHFASRMQLCKSVGGRHLENL